MYLNYSLVAELFIYSHLKGITAGQTAGETSITVRMGRGGCVLSLMYCTYVFSGNQLLSCPICRVRDCPMHPKQ